MSRRWLIIGVAVLALLLVAGGAVAIAIDKRRMAELLRAAATAAGVDPDVAEAIGRTESNLNSRAVNKAGRDGQRGGAWGATQITLKTAAAFGFTGTGDELLASPEKQAELTARILAAGPHGAPEDSAAWWNAGKRSLAAVPETLTVTQADGTQKTIPHPTRATYVPRFLEKLQDVRDDEATA